MLSLIIAARDSLLKRRSRRRSTRHKSSYEVEAGSAKGCVLSRGLARHGEWCSVVPSAQTETPEQWCLVCRDIHVQVKGPGLDAPWGRTDPRGENHADIVFAMRTVESWRLGALEAGMEPWQICGISTIVKTSFGELCQ